MQARRQELEGEASRDSVDLASAIDYHAPKEPKKYTEDFGGAVTLSGPIEGKKMTNYVMDKEKLKEILLSHKSFLSMKCRELISKGVDLSKITYKESDKLTDEFIETMIHKLSVDDLLDKVDEVMEKNVGFNSKEAMKRKKQSLLKKTVS
jgi:hypothetical protein